MPYVESLSEDTHRERGLRDDEAMVQSCHGIVLVGGVVSSGMRREMEAAARAGIPCVNLTAMGYEPPDDPNYRASILMCLGQLR